MGAIIILVLQFLAGSLGFASGEAIFIGAYGILLLFSSFMFGDAGTTIGSIVVIQGLHALACLWGAKKAGEWLSGGKKQKAPKNTRYLYKSDQDVKQALDEAIRVIKDMVKAGPGISLVGTATSQEHPDREMFEGDLYISPESDGRYIGLELSYTGNLKQLLALVYKKCLNPTYVWIRKEFCGEEKNQEVEYVKEFAEKYAHCLQDYGTSARYCYRVKIPTGGSGERLMELLHEEIEKQCPKVEVITKNEHYRIPSWYSPHK